MIPTSEYTLSKVEDVEGADSVIFQLLQGLLEFLDHEPFYHDAVFSRMLGEQFSNETYMAALFSILTEVMLRRTVKDTGTLPINRACDNQWTSLGWELL
jgi:hypothetical protein